MLNVVNISTMARLRAAKSSLDNRQYAPAEMLLAGVLHSEPENHVALALAAEAFAGEGRWREAISHCMRAIRANPAEICYQEMLIRWGGEAPLMRYEALAEGAILACLKSADRVDCSQLWPLWLSHIMSTPAFQGAYGEMLAGMMPHDPANRVAYERGLTDLRPLLMPCFLLGIKNIVVHTSLFEEFITQVRRRMVLDGGKLSRGEMALLAEALSYYAFQTEFILDCTEEEQQLVEALQARVEAGQEDAAGILVLACYVPLHRLRNRDALASVPPAGAEGVIQVQIRDCIALHRTAAEVVAMTPTKDAVSQAVQEQYEAFPYPRYTRFSRVNFLRNWSHDATSVEIEGPLRGKRTILIAGCGTGFQVLEYAALYPEAEILAMDLSLNSLAYAIQKAREHHVDNVTFRQGDILQLSAEHGSFDYVIAIGVLHHLADPVKGWRNLCGLLKPGGLMHIGLYSKLARRALARAQATAKAGGYASDEKGIRDFRRRSAQILEPAVLQDLGRWVDYYYMSMCRDLLFHAQERHFDLMELGDILRDLGLAFLGFYAPAALEAYGRAYPGDVLKADLQRWHMLEGQNPDMFRDMYVFWCRKKGQAGS